MKELSTTKFIVKSRESIIDFLYSTFQDQTLNHKIQDPNAYFESLILEDLNLFQLNIIEIDDEKKAKKYLDIQLILLKANRNKINYIRQDYSLYVLNQFSNSREKQQKIYQEQIYTLY